MLGPLPAASGSAGGETSAESDIYDSSATYELCLPPQWGLAPVEVRSVDVYRDVSPGKVLVKNSGEI